MSKVTKKLTKARTNKWEWPLLGLMLAGSFLLRVLPQLSKVFVSGHVWFRGTDDWYHLRLAEAVSFPQWIRWDMYAQFPSGAASGYKPLLAWLAVTPTVGAFVPPAAGILALFFVYLIGKHLFSRSVGFLAVVLTSIIPGEFLHRTLLGHMDHHCLEALFMLASVYFLLRLKSNYGTRWAVLLGVSLGLYALAWAGISIFLLIVAVWLWWECLAKLRKGESLLPVVRSVGIAVGIACLMAALFVDRLTLPALLGLWALPTVTWIITLVLKDREKILFGLTVAVPIGLVILGNVIDLRSAVLSIFWGGGSTIQEAVPLDLHAILSTYGIMFFAAFIGLWFHRKVDVLFVVWFILIVAMSIGQRRWGYYAAAPIGILAAAATVKISSYLQKNLQVAAAVVIAAFLILPNIRGTTQVVQMPVLMNADWYVTLTWLKQNTPDPFPSDDYYYTSHDLSVKPSYGILSWWDYGHWVIEIAHRVPIDSPTQVSGIPSQFLTATTEEEANTWLPENVPYVIIDETLLTTKWPAVLVRAEKEPKPVTESFLYTLWTEQAQTWTKIYERNGIKVYKRSPPGDYLMQGIKGELYICDKEIFEATYEWVEVNK